MLLSIWPTSIWYWFIILSHSCLIPFSTKYMFINLVIDLISVFEGRSTKWNKTFGWTRFWAWLKYIVYCSEKLVKLVKSKITNKEDYMFRISGIRFAIRVDTESPKIFSVNFLTALERYYSPFIFFRGTLCPKIMPTKMKWTVVIPCVDYNLLLNLLLSTTISRGSYICYGNLTMEVPASPMTYLYLCSAKVFAFWLQKGVSSLTWIHVVYLR